MTANGERISALIAELDVPTNGRRRTHVDVRKELAAFGREAVDHLISLLPGDDVAAWTSAQWTFEHFGVEALEPLISALRTDRSGYGPIRVQTALASLALPDRAAVFLPYFTDPDGAVREAAVGAFKEKESDILEHKDAILELMSDPVEDVRCAAYDTLGSVGRELIPFLTRARRTAAAPARPLLREMLLELVGFQEMDARDQAAIRRFIEIRSLGEQPEPMHLCGWWYAVRTADQQAVLDAFDLSDPLPVSMHTGADAWNRDHHEWYSHSGCRRMYVSPAFDGWTLVFGESPDIAHMDTDEDAFRKAQTGLITGLSTRFGEAHWYSLSCGDGLTAWGVARDGELVDQYDNWNVSVFDDDHVERYATDVARELSINPEDLGPQTEVNGRAVLALTSCGRENGAPTGVLDI